MFQDRPGICQFVPLDHHPPPIDFTASLLPSVSPRLALHSLGYYCSFPLASSFDSLRSPSFSFVSPPACALLQLLPLSLFPFSRSLLFSSRAALSRSCLRIFSSAPISLRTTFSATFSLSSLSSSSLDRSAADPSFGPLAKNHGDPGVSFTRLNPSIRSGSYRREPRHFSMKYRRSADQIHVGRRASALSRTSFGSLMIALLITRSLAAVRTPTAFCTVVTSAEGFLILLLGKRTGVNRRLAPNRNHHDLVSCSKRNIEVTYFEEKIAARSP